MVITEIICQVLRVPVIQRKTASSQDAVLVRIRTDHGLEGIGEADSQPEVVKAIIDAGYSHNIACGLRELLLGEDPLDHVRLWQKMLRGTMYFGRASVTITAMAAIDMALWDLKGKHVGVPIHQLLGGKQHHRIQAYASCLFGNDGHQTRDIAARWRDAGYSAVKFGWEPMGPDLKVDLDLVRGARQGIGDGTLLIDAGCVWDARTALKRTRAFEEYELTWLEEPLRSDDVEGYRWLRDRSSIPIAGGEQECGRESWKPLIDRRALDVYQVDLARNGFTEADYIKHRVQEIGARLCNHCYTSPLTVAASLHWLFTCRDAFLFEDCVDDSPLRHHLTCERVQADDGWVTVPEGPGLGVTLDEEFVQRYLVDESGRNQIFGEKNGHSHEGVAIPVVAGT
ncbi:mandelate racemase/muconate lactonizing enzyme family protein [Planctomicrobium sp. SH661]|uniref:mandelate racemase/muconate lactonizing enzyme family protein n=1 Tax=Planctomicrobium sp. SH661 TaxID=3448124 RepID=UPI003F5BFFDF